jgi:hypothetical protein
MKPISAVNEGGVPAAAYWTCVLETPHASDGAARDGKGS